MNSTVEIVIENLIAATVGENAGNREKHVLRESLRGLVRFAEAEQMLEIKANVKKLTAPITINSMQYQSELNLLEGADMSQPQLRQFIFGKNTPAQSHPTCDQKEAE
jgi:hypothetical protein